MNNRVQIEPLAFIKWLLMSLIAILAWQTISIQVVNREVYQTKTESMVVSTKDVHADRGRILDRQACKPAHWEGRP